MSSPVSISVDGSRLGKFLGKDYVVVDVQSAKRLATFKCCETGSAKAAVFSQDGESVALIGDKTGVWGVDGREPRLWGFEAIAITSTGKDTWAGLSKDGTTIRLVDGEGETTKTLSGGPPHENDRYLSYSADGQRFLVWGFGALQVWSVGSEAMTYDLDKDRSAPVGTDNVGWAGLGKDGALVVHDESKKHVLGKTGTWSSAPIPTHARRNGDTDTLNCTNDGLVCVETSDRGVEVGRDGQPRVRISELDVASAHITESGHRLAVSDFASVAVWDAKTGNVLTPKYEPPIELLAASGGETFVTSDGQQVATWEVGASTPSVHIDVEDLSELFLSPDGATAFGLRKTDLVRVNLAGRSVEADTRMHFKGLGVSQDWTQAVVEVGSGRVALLDMGTSEFPVAVGPYSMVFDLTASSVKGAFAVDADYKIMAWIDEKQVVDVKPTGSAEELVFTPDGQHLVAAIAESHIAVYGMSGGAEERQLAQELHVERVNFLRGGSYLVTGGTDGAVRLFDFVTGRELAASTQHQQPVSDVAVLSEDTVVSLDEGGTLITWDFTPVLPPAGDGPG